MPRLAGFLSLVLAATVSAQSVPAPIATDPQHDAAHPTVNIEMSVPSHGEQLFGVFYLSSGDRPHPTVLLLHGFPGYEQQLDLGQALRRAGWNVLALHYRGSWGVHGAFSFTHSMEDTDAEVAFLQEPAAAAKYHIDPKRIVVIGHSMGGYMAASAASHNKGVAGVVMIGAWNIGHTLHDIPDDQKAVTVGRIPTLEGMEPADFLPLSGCTPQSLSAEMFGHRRDWDFVRFAPALAARPVLLLTADDGSDPDSTRLLTALQSAGNTRASKIHTATDHGFSDRRIHLESLILKWLAALPQ